MLRLPPDWREFFESLLAHDVKFLVVGALAVAAHAEPRATEDLDVFVEPTLENARRLRRALLHFGFPSIPPAEQLQAPGAMLMLGRKPMRIDVLKAIDGVTFDQAWRGHVVVAIEGLRLPVIGVIELLINKRAAGRNKDLRDVDLIERVVAGRKKRGKAPKRR
jgi:predicted nucleotidyltransferase